MLTEVKEKIFLHRLETFAERVLIRFQRVLTGRHVGNIGRFRDVDFVDAVLHRSLRVFTLFNDQELVIIDGGDIAEFHCGVLFIRAGRDRVRGVIAKPSAPRLG